MARKILTILLFPVLLYGVASAQNVDAIIKKNTVARGGIEKMKAVKSATMTGKIVLQGMEAPMMIKMKRPGMVRSELTIQNMTMIQGYDGTTAWMVMPLMGKSDPEPMAAEDAKNVAEQADFDGPLVDYKAKGHKVELAGKEDVGSSPAYKLKVSLKNGDIRYLYLDAGNYLEVKETSKRQTPGGEVELETYFSGYKPVNGLMIPHATESKVKGQTVSQITFTKVEINPQIPDSVFKMPLKAAEVKTETPAADSTKK